MLAGFRFIEKYQNMAKDLDQETSSVSLNLDQEVPEYIYFYTDLEMKQRIKTEEYDSQPDLFNMMESIMSNDSVYSNITSNSSSSSNSASFFGSNSDNNFMTTNSQTTTTTAPTLSSTLPSFLTSSSSPLLSSTTSSECSGATTHSSSNPDFTSRLSNFITEFGRSDCTVVPSTNFLTDSNSTIPSLCGPDDSPKYIDMDKHQISLFGADHPALTFSKPMVMTDESKRLEEAAILMRDTIYNDCEHLNIPYDPTAWTCEHVRKWVSWVCERNNVPDVASLLYNVDGSTLCSMDQDTFCIIYRDSGMKLSNELELWKAANSCFPNQICNTNNSDLPSSCRSQQLNNPFMETQQTFSLTQCVSPALSSCSSNHDSLTSTHSDHSDDESIYGSRIPASSGSVRFEANSCYNNILKKIPSGRGHKQTIHLWQFLQELLLTKDNNHGNCIRWLDRKTGVFKIEDSKKVATLWGARKNRPAMNYDKLSRSVRQYYKKGIIKKTEQSKRLVYQFCPGYL